MWLIQTIVVVSDNSQNGYYFQDWFLYSEQEERQKKIREMKIRNEQIKEFNEISKRQITLLKESKELKNKADNIINGQ